MNKCTIPIRGMHCASCEILVGEQLKKIPGVTHAKVNQKIGQAEIHYSGEKPNADVLAKAVATAGYQVGEKEKLPWLSRRGADYADLARAGLILLVLYFVARWFGLFNLNVNSGNSGVMVALLVGLVAGLSTCMALVGGLVLGISARHAEKHPEATAMQKFRPHIYFNLGRIIGYAVLGGMIGLVGQAVKPSVNTLGFLTMVIGAVMIFFGLKLIEIFPALRDKNITLPSGVARFFGLNNEVKEYSPKSAMVTGALTFFLPCGFTQAMQLYAVSTGSFWQGMTIMGLFALGTAPGLLGVGGLSSFFKGRKARLFFMAAGLAVIMLGWYNLNNGRELLGGASVKNNSAIVAPANGTVQEVRMTQNNNGYTPDTFTVVKGRPVKWIINSTSQYSCAASIVMRKFGINQGLNAGENIINFTPTEVGTIPFSCSMGMYRGKFIVVEAGGDVSAAAVDSSTDSIAGGCSIASGSAGAKCGAGGCGGCGGGN